MTLRDGPHFMHDPADGDFARFANVFTGESGARIVSDGQRVYILDDLLRQGYLFVPVVAMTPQRVAALRWAFGRVAGLMNDNNKPMIEALDALLAEVE